MLYVNISIELEEKKAVYSISNWESQECVF